ncbi:hypothetical protein C8A03DRAFT_38203 [Achaetomium macrosporum]|uniref:Rho-GAP domain-containing protein n=1 Tax=Achaetomium macrosporum TaxID=79813 RepID=A0AAN7C2D7_9PEZI|nr:hypothetical protein C8A03DRAFT_38203 [Achaetomium macrosporum]
MDRITTVSAACSAASDAIARTSLALNDFVREVRESRSEFDAISTQVHSLDGVLDLLRYDAAFFPASLAQHTPAVLETCLSLISELEGCVSVLNRPGISRAEKKSRWLASRHHVNTLQWTLGEYKLVLGLTADLVGVIKSQASDNDEQGPPEYRLRSDTALGSTNEPNELATVAAGIIDVTRSLQKELNENAALAKLGHYLHVLQEQAVAAGGYTESRPELRAHRRMVSSSLGGPPDSAIDMSYDDAETPPSPVQKEAVPPSSVDDPPTTRSEETDDFAGELYEMPVQVPPPLPPPRSAARLRSAAASRGPGRLPSTTDSRSSADYSAATPSEPSSPGSSVFSAATPLRPAQESYYTPVTELSDPLEEEIPPRPETRTHSCRSGFVGQVLSFVWENPRSEVPSPPSRPTTSGSDLQVSSRHRPNSNPLRRSSSKLSISFRNLGLRRRPSLKTVQENPNVDLETDPGAVFGVPLAQSMLVAKGIASTRHGDKGSSVREYPLCVLRCVYHIRDCGLETTPYPFGIDGDSQLRLAQLKALFSAVETGYGKELDWSGFTVHDAADLILLFLSELPNPLIPESVAKRWVSLSRQATTIRLDQGLDFWEEAFMGIRGHGRALFKLLLNLWGDIADAAAATHDKTAAERLAARVIRPLLHAPATAAAARHRTDFMLGLAFLIRKRSEYNLAAMGLTRKSNAAF